MAAIVLFAFVALAPASAGSQSFPLLTGRVVDAADLLEPEERAALEGKLKVHEDRTSNQVVVATVPSLEGRRIEEYANRLFNTWKLGEKTKNNGVLLLIAPNERKMRIEVGYGLEGILTDAVSKLVIDAHMTPKFRSNDFAAGIGACVEAILSILQEEADRIRAQIPQRRDENAAYVHKGGRVEPFAGELVDPVPVSEEEFHWHDPRRWTQFELPRLPYGGLLLVIIFLLAAIFIPRRLLSGNGSSGGSGASSSRSSYSGRGGSSGGGGASGGW